MTGLLSTGWSIQPVQLGVMTVDTSQLVRGQDLGAKVQIPCIAWVLRGADGVIVVDTGPADASWSAEFHNPMVRPPEEGVEAAFAAVGVDVADVEVVINTHLHWDHCYGNVHFRNARFWVQRAELDYARTPCPCDLPIYETDHAAPYEAVRERFSVVDGRVEVVPGVTLLPTPGHTPGHQSVLVQGHDRRLVIAGDAVGLFRNLDGAGAPGSLYTDLPAWYDSLALMRDAADLVLPGHDPRVFDQEVYT